MYKLAAIIPAFNEEQAIADVVHQIKAVGKRESMDITVVVVNDCSRDNTGPIIDGLPCVALHLPVIRLWRCHWLWRRSWRT